MAGGAHTPDEPDHGREPPSYRRYRAGPQLPRRRSERSSAERRGSLGGPWGVRRALRWVAIVLGVWLALSIVLFLLSAQFAAPHVSDATRSALDGGSLPPFSATNVLVLGSDQRTRKTHEPGASTGGPSRSDVMLLIRTGAGHSARLSVPRDTVVQIPGHGMQKINAAYAFGGAALAIQTVKSYLGIKVNHVVEINFDHFPQLIDAMGGIDFSTSTCVVSLINGGFRNGGYTLRLRKGTSHLDGKAALAIARTRHNLCHRNDSDLDRARRQQELFNAMKHRLLTVSTLLRLPFVSWQAPQALKTDMRGPTLIGLFAGLEVAGSPSPMVLKPSGPVTLPDGSVGLSVSESARRAAVARFLNG